jgi:hypothetical protein
MLPIKNTKTIVNNMKYIITESQYNKAIGKFISRKFNGVKVTKLFGKDSIIFWSIDNKIIAQINNRNDFVISPNIFNEIKDMFNLEDKETESVISEWLVNHYEMGILSVYKASSDYEYGWPRLNHHLFSE